MMNFKGFYFFSFFSDAPASYILHIFNLQTADQGFYECSVDKTNQTLTYQLQITGRVNYIIKILIANCFN